MKRIAIVGGGIAGLSAAYELTRQQRAELVLFEASNRLGGIVETVRRDGFVIECGPDSWVTEKPWARELAVELGLDDEIIFSQDTRRTTYLAEGGTLHPMPQGMRMMVPVEWEGLLSSPLLSDAAKQNYLREPERAEELKAAALESSSGERDGSVRDFIVRHFGEEVADTFAAPLLAGVFGGDIATLSARAVLPAYVALEREFGSLIIGLQEKRKHGGNVAPIFSSLRHGVAGLVNGLASRIAADNIRCDSTLGNLERVGEQWRLRIAGEEAEIFDAVLMATPTKMTGRLLAPLNPQLPELLPQRSSSAIVVGLAFVADRARALRIPEGFGFLVPQRDVRVERDSGGESLEALAQRALLACTFVDQKFADRVPPGGILLRAFFGGSSAPALLQENDATLRTLALTALGNILGKLPEPAITVVRRWPDSLPLYEVGHVQRMARLDLRMKELPNLRLIGNAYRGVGLPDLIRDGRIAAREMLAGLD